MKDTALVSVVTPVYNGVTFIVSTYECLCHQTYTNWEWVVVNDGSTDGTEALLKHLAISDPRVRYFNQKNSGSAKYTRDHAVYETKGAFILPLDADDKIENDYISKMTSRQRETDADIVYPQMHFVDLDTGETTKILPVKEFDTSKVYQSRDLIRETAPEWNIGCNGGLYRRSIWINMSFPEKHEPIWMNSDEVDERLYLIHAKTAAFATARYYYQNHAQSITAKITPKIFHTQKTCLQLIELAEQEFGKDSEEYRRMMRRAFCDWRWKTALYVCHHDELSHADAEIQQNLATCFRRLDNRALSFAERIQFLNLVSYPLILALFCLKYKPSLLLEIIIRRFCPKVYMNKYVRRRTEQEIDSRLADYYHEEKALDHYRPHVISMFCGNAPSGGLTDRLRGVVSTFQACQATGRTFKLHFTHPFYLTDYLIPNSYDWSIHAEEITFAPSQSETLIASSVNDTSRERELQRQQIQTTLDNNLDKQIHVYTNAAFCYDNDFANTFHTLFKPSARLQKSIDNVLSDIGGQYITVSARFCNCFDDFNEEVYCEPLSTAERRDLLDRCMTQLAQIAKQHPHKRLVICSDSTTFIQEAKKHFDIITTTGTISHIGNDDIHNYKYYEKTFLDFYIIAEANESYLLKGPHMMQSGFPYAASLIGHKTLKVIHF